MTLMFWSTVGVLDAGLLEERLGEGDQHGVVAAQKLDHRRTLATSCRSREAAARGAALCHRVALCRASGAYASGEKGVCCGRRAVVRGIAGRARLDRAAGRGHRRRDGAGQPPRRRAHQLRRGADPRGGALPDRFRRQAAPPDGDDRLGPRLRLSRRRRREARGERRVHAHGDALPRRRGRRERHAPGQARGAARLGQPGERAGRRFPARPGLQDDGRGRLARGAGGALRRRRDDRRRRGDAARHRQEHRDHRGRISRRDPREDGGAVLRRGRGRRRSSPGPSAACAPPSAPTAPISASPSS